MSRRILLASYHFPPEAAVGGLRIAKFARLLPEFGWEPLVLTARDEIRGGARDDSRLRGLESVPVIQTGELPRLVEAAGAVRAAMTRRPRATQLGVTTPVASAMKPETISQRLNRYLVSLIALLPDEKKNWSLRASATAVRLVRTRRIEWLLTSGPPFSAHVIGLIATALTGVRWIADFRDPWIDMLRDRFPHVRSEASDRLERMMEAAVVEYADRIVTTTDRMRESMAARYPAAPTGRFVCIPNGIDAAAFPPQRDIPKYDSLTITYAGALYFDRTPEPLFRAVRDLMASHSAVATQIRIKLIGQCRYVDGIETRAIADRYGLADSVEVIDPVAYSEALRIMQRSHLLLMLAPERHRLVVPAKMFDYLGSGTPVLAIAESGATADFIAETKCGHCFSAADREGLRDYLARLLDGEAFRTMKNETAMFARYDARRMTERLVGEMALVDAGALEGAVAGT